MDLRPGQPHPSCWQAMAQDDHGAIALAVVSVAVAVGGFATVCLLDNLVTWERLVGIGTPV